MAKKILLRAGTDAQRLTMTPTSRELIWTTDTKKVYAGDGVTVGGILIGPGAVGTTETFAYQNGTDGSGTHITGAGNTNVALGANDLEKIANIIADGGGGIYIATITLQTTNGNAGEKIRLMITLPASANPTIEVRNATSGGTLLKSLNNVDAVDTLYWSGEFRYTGSAWVYAGGAYESP
jgi:Major tropism determinant N-terminal domain